MSNERMVIGCGLLGTTFRRDTWAMIWYIAFGSAVGGVSRHLLGSAVQRAVGTPFPMGTLLVNVTGSLLLGFLVRYLVGATSVSPEMRALVTTGFCGGYTTFSAFSYETAYLFEQGDVRRGAMYVVASVGLSLVGTIAGISLARGMTGGR
jgi:CrcB protein